nr:MAG TPA: protein of unknown function (DUF4761) [Caudoviricetes sp.]
MTQLVQLNSHSFLYRGFTIHKCPRNPLTMKNSYRIFSKGEYYGRDFALIEAMIAIDNLHVDGAKNETPLR